MKEDLRHAIGHLIAAALDNQAVAELARSTADPANDLITLRIVRDDARNLRLRMAELLIKSIRVELQCDAEYEAFQKREREAAENAAVPSKKGMRDIGPIHRQHPQSPEQFMGKIHQDMADMQNALKQVTAIEGI